MFDLVSLKVGFAFALHLGIVRLTNSPPLSSLFSIISGWLRRIRNHTYTANASKNMQLPPTLFTFVRDGGKGSQRTIRSHAMADVRRKQREHRKSLLEERREQDVFTPRLSFCTCIFRVPDPPTLTTQLSSSEDVRKQLHADSYKLCPICYKIQFLERSRNGQLAVSRRLFPDLVPFLEAELDPFLSQPGLPFQLRPEDNRELNEVKAHCESEHIHRVSSTALVSLIVNSTEVTLKRMNPSAVITFYSPGAIKTVTIPAAMKDPALFMSMMYLGFAYMYARKRRPMSHLSLAVKAEAVRLINQKIGDLQQATTPENIAAITYLSTGVRVCAYFCHMTSIFLLTTRQNFGAPLSADEVRVHEAGIEALLLQRPGGIQSLSITPFGQALQRILAM
jgi:hypothetical protein